MGKNRGATKKCKGETLWPQRRLTSHVLKKAQSSTVRPSKRETKVLGDQKVVGAPVRGMKPCLEWPGEKETAGACSTKGPDLHIPAEKRSSVIQGEWGRGGPDNFRSQR